MKAKETSSFAEVVQMSSEERAIRTHKKRLYYLLVELNKAIHDAKKAKIDIGKVSELDVKAIL